MSIDSSVSATSSVLDQYMIKENTRNKGSELGKDDFLNLLVTQLNNQDPLSPQDNGEFIAQLAQFSQLEGTNNLNASMETLLSSYQSSQALQASSLVGRKVIVPSDRAEVDTSQTFKGSLTLPASSANVAVNVYDRGGALVNTINLGQQTAGNVSFMWDGKGADGNLLPPGTYRFEARAAINNETVALATNLPANVDSVTLGQGGGELMLNLAGLGSIGLSKVQVIGQ